MLVVRLLQNKQIRIVVMIIMDHSDGPSTRLYWLTSDVLYISNLIFHIITIVSKHSIIIMYQSKIKTLRSADMSEQDLTVHDKNEIIENRPKVKRL